MAEYDGRAAVVEEGEKMAFETYPHQEKGECKINVVGCRSEGLPQIILWLRMRSKIIKDEVGDRSSQPEKRAEALESHFNCYN